MIPLENMKNVKRIIPTTMASQHPDHAGVPYWHDEAFIATGDETRECFLDFSELGINEYKWDWEGKLVDESVLERLYGEYYEYFKKHPLGKDVFITFRLPNPKVETEFRLGRAFMNILSACSFAKQVGMHTPPFFEAILPMTENALSLVAIQEAFREMTDLKHDLYRLKDNTLKHLDLIPLFESVNTILGSNQILREYIGFHEELFGSKPTYLRPYVARSDPALNAGMIPTVLAIKIALAQFEETSRQTNIPFYPIIGCAALPFRGGLNPYNIESFAKEYAGIRTTLIQSAFRYDYPKADVIKAIQQLNQLLPKSRSKAIEPKEVDLLKSSINNFTAFYQPTIEQLAPTINLISGHIPKRRERVQHVGLFGYSRGVGKVRLPRAISFTASLYSLGVPPELIGTGRGLAEATRNGKLAIIERHYLNLRSDLTRAGRYANKEVLTQLAKTGDGWQDVLDDITGIEEYLGTTLEPNTKDEFEHHKLTHRIYTELNRPERLGELITEAALLRHSMG